MFPKSLLKYENPRLILLHKEQEEPEEKIKERPVSPQIAAESTEELLDIALPPRKFEKDGKLWIQRVSRSPATENDVLNLQDQIDRELSLLAAKEIGICPIRRHLYSQCFDELIRQEFIACPERGKLYKRIRNESQMTVNNLRNVYESNIAYGIKKVLAAKYHDREVEKEYKKLLEERPLVSQKLNSLENEFIVIENKFKEDLVAQLEYHKMREGKMVEENKVLLQDMKDLLDKDFMEYED